MQENERQLVTVRLVKARAERTIEYPGRVLSNDGNHIVVEAPWIGDKVDLGVVVFQEGDVFLEHYWRDRWYTVKEVRRPDGVFKGWYCDATRPAVFADELVTSVDLDLDLWVSAERQQIVRLDEDEFLASGLTESDPAAARAARSSIDELEKLAIQGAPPFA
jgi:predicted RNA-binding protein associated with RNAse of E/G family